MTEVLTKAIIFFMIILIGYLLKRIGLFQKDDHKVVAKIVFRLTLPCAVITSFTEGYEKDPSLYLILLLGLLCNLSLWGFGILTSRGRGTAVRALYTQNMAGFNIGAFTMPYVQSFLGPFGVVTACMFDIGNSVMCTGGNYALTSTLMGQGSGGKWKAFFKKLFSSVPLDTALFLLLLSLFDLSVPQPVLALTSRIGEANGFLAMLMIGMMVEFSLDASRLRQAAFVLAVRYMAAAAFSLLFYFVLPLSLELRQVLVLLCFAPVPSMSPFFTEQLCGDASVSGVVNSVSVAVSITAITALAMAMGVSM